MYHLSQVHHLAPAVVLPLHCFYCHLQIMMRRMRRMMVDDADDYVDHCDYLQFDDINLFFTLLVIGEVDKPVSSVSD